MIPDITRLAHYLQQNPAIHLHLCSISAKRARNLAVNVSALIPVRSQQLEMFAQRSHAVARAMDRINDRYDEFVIKPALMMGMDDTIIDHIAFGGVKELEELYQQ
jgi:hypothetical protein